MTQKSSPRYILVITLLALFVTSALATQTATGTKTKPASPACDDATVAAQVKEALSKDRLLDGQYINVEVKDRVVTLSGFVCNVSKKNRASADAKKVKWVKTVANNVQLGASIGACAGGTPCCCCNDQGQCECAARAGGRCCVQAKK